LNDGTQTHYFGHLQAQTFCAPRDFGDPVSDTGLSAVLISEVRNLGFSGSPRNPYDLYYDYFLPFGWPTDGGGEYFLLSQDEINKWADATLGLSIDGTFYRKAISITRKSSADGYARSVGAYEASGATKLNPVVFPANNSGVKPPKPADVTWDGENFSYAKARLPHVAGSDMIEAGYTELAQQGAWSVAHGAQMAGYGEVLLRYTHNMSVSSLECVSEAKKAGEKARWKVCYANYTPWQTPNARVG